MPITRKQATVIPQCIWVACMLCMQQLAMYHHYGSRNGTVVRALASHQCGPGSIPGLGVICGLSLLLVLVPAPSVFLRVRFPVSASYVG